MILNFKVKEKALHDIKGKWISLAIIALIVALIGWVFTCVYDLLTIDLREEIIRLETELNKFDIIKDAENEEFIKVLENINLANTALTIYSLITAVGGIIAGAFCISVASIFLSVARGQNHEISDTKRIFKRIKEGFLLNLIKTLYVFLWSLLLIVPGIIKYYSYMMADYIKAENPEMSAREALKASENFMMGYKKQFFLFEISYIGWWFLVGVGEMLIWSMIPGNNAWLILGNLLVVIIYLPLTVYFEAGRANYFFALHEEKSKLTFNRRVSEQMASTRDVFREFENARKGEQNPFDDFEIKNKRDNDDPFEGF